MVTYLKLKSIRQVAKRLFILSNQRGSLCECILTSLAMFGLAAQGDVFIITGTATSRGLEMRPRRPSGDVC